MSNPSLPDKLRELAAFDCAEWDAAIMRAGPNVDDYLRLQKHAAQDENARLRPLIEALVRVADIADKYYRGADCSCDNCFQCDFAKAIAELERLVEGEK